MFKDREIKQFLSDTRNSYDHVSGHSFPRRDNSVNAILIILLYLQAIMDAM